ncbi:MAG: desulfoferrodoxin family protein [Bacilli bacterium]|nr:desulfoferrodoxin family protein [Bacilli bacterium]
MLKFYKCPVCGNVILKVVDHNIPVVCCGKPMIELKENTTDAVLEKHIPVVEFDGDVMKVSVGSIIHPHTEEHHIAFIAVDTIDGLFVKNLKILDEPIATFKVNKDGVKAVYEYCNLHGLWKKEL